MVSKPSKAALRAQKQIAKHATGEVTVRDPGGVHEMVFGVIGSDEIEVRIQNGVVMAHHTQPRGSVSQPETDYFPGSYWSSLAAAIASCLPDRRKALPCPDVKGTVVIALYYWGAGMKDEATLEFRLETGFYFDKWEKRKIKGGQLLDGIRHAYATGCTAQLIDWLMENEPTFLAYWERAVEFAAQQAVAKEAAFAVGAAAEW